MFAELRIAHTYGMTLEQYRIWCAALLEGRLLSWGEIICNQPGYNAVLNVT